MEHQRVKGQLYSHFARIGKALANPKRLNRAFAIEDLGAFTEYMLKEIPERPPRAEHIRAANLGFAALRA